MLEFKQGEEKIPALDKVKKIIQNPKNKSQNDDLTELQNDIKNSIKNLYISDQKKKKDNK